MKLDKKEKDIIYEALYFYRRRLRDEMENIKDKDTLKEYEKRIQETYNLWDKISKVV